MEDKERDWTSCMSDEEEDGLRKGHWTEEEDKLLSDYVSVHGDRRWNHVARCSGLKRNGKSCRLRWRNHLRPNVRHGNLTLQEQYSILKFQSLWGNRWSKIAQQLPGRTDNEIKNYYRTRVLKQAKQLNCDVDSKLFKETMRHVLMPRLQEQMRIHSSSSASSSFQQIDGQYSAIEPDPNHHRPSDVSGTEPNSPGDFSTVRLSPDTDPVNGYVQCDDLVTGSGLYPDNLSFEDFNDCWGYGTDYNLWDEDSFSFWF